MRGTTSAALAGLVFADKAQADLKLERWRRGHACGGMLGQLDHQGVQLDLEFFGPPYALRPFLWR